MMDTDNGKNDLYNQFSLFKLIDNQMMVSYEIT
jgi:hypothetical protein